MKRFAVSDPSFASRIEALSGAESEHEIETAFARAVFSLITEPGDSFAGALSSALTISKFLELEIQRADAKTMRTCLAECGALAEIESKFIDFESSLSEARQRWGGRLKLNEVSHSLELALKTNARLLTPEHQNWPPQLQDLGMATPHCLWVRSRTDLDVLNEQQIAIVGSRNATSYGEWVASEIVADASARGLSIVSGGAYGIDAISHRAAIAHDSPTIAFMAGGIDRLYPSGNASLLERVMANGAVLAEQAPGAMPTKWRFLQRNRLIAALGEATIVVEAGARSGALNTVTHAHALEREVGAVPGSISSQASAGCNRLIAEQMATAICQVGDAADLVLGKQGWFQAELEGLGALETRAFDELSSRPQSQNEIAARAGLTSKEVSIALGQLSLLGFVEQRERGWVKLPLEREQRPSAIGK